ncbi:MAG: glycosyltransferase family 39 protein, partial [Patescibacteria group bacterium]
MSSLVERWSAYGWTGALVLAGLAISMIGLRYGLPLHLLGDEESLIGGALTMLQLRTALPILHPQAFALLYYPPVIPYIIILFSAPVIILKWITVGLSFAELQNYFALHQEGIWFAARAASAVSAAGVAIITYLLAQRLYSRRVAYVALAFLSVSFMHVNLAHWMKHWSFSILCAYLVFFLTVRYVQNGHGRRWMPGFAAGVAAGITSITVLGGIAAAIYALWNRTKLSNARNFALLNVVLWVAVGGVLIALHAPYFVKEYGGLFSLALSGTGRSFSLISILATVAFGFRALFYSDPVIFFGALAGLLLAYRYRSQNRSVLIGTFVYFIVLHVFFHFETRYIYAVIPALSIAAGSLIDVLYEKMGRIAASIILIALLAYPAAVALRFDYL